jgi:hypothetical protein
MPKLVIDDLTYNTEDLSDAGKAQLVSLQYVEQALLNFKNEMAVYQTAQQSYLRALKAEIADEDIQPIDEDDLNED